MYQREELLQQMYGIRDMIIKIEKNADQFATMRCELRHAKDEHLTTEQKKAGLRDVLFMAVIIFGIFTSIANFNLAHIITMQIIPVVIYEWFHEEKQSFSDIVLGYVFLNDIYQAVQALSYIKVFPALVIGIGFVVSATMFFRMKKHYLVYASTHIEKTEIIKKLNDITAECYHLDRALRQNTKGWYPQKYLHYDAVEFFIKTLEKKGHIDTLKELVERYELETCLMDFFSMFGCVPTAKEKMDDTMDKLCNWQRWMHFQYILNVYQCMEQSL